MKISFGQNNFNNGGKLKFVVLIIIVLITFIIPLITSLLAFGGFGDKFGFAGDLIKLTTQMAGDLKGPENIEIPGNAAAFDIIADFPKIASFVGENPHLMSLSADFVKSDGTMEFTADYGTRADLVFFIDAQAPENPKPMGTPGGSVDGKWYQRVNVLLDKPNKTVSVRSMGGGLNKSYTYVNKGMEKNLDDVSGSKPSPGKEVQYPKCNFKDLWKVAIEKGANSNAVARIDYDSSGYQFSIDNAGSSLWFDENCKFVR